VGSFNIIKFANGRYQNFVSGQVIRMLIANKGQMDSFVAWHLMELSRDF